MKLLPRYFLRVGRTGGLRRVGVVYMYVHREIVPRHENIHSGASHDVSLHVAPALEWLVRLPIACGQRVRSGVAVFIAEGEPLLLVRILHDRILLYLVNVVAIGEEYSWQYGQVGECEGSLATIAARPTLKRPIVRGDRGKGLVALLWYELRHWEIVGRESPFVHVSILESCYHCITIDEEDGFPVVGDIENIKGVFCWEGCHGHGHRAIPLCRRCRGPML